MKKNIAISFLGILLVASLVMNYFLLEWAVKGSYALDAQLRLIVDTKILSASINKEVSLPELMQAIRDRDSSLEIVQLENTKSQWDWNGPAYPAAIRVAGSMTYYFNSEGALERVDHWLAENSPLYERTR